MSQPENGEKPAPTPQPESDFSAPSVEVPQTAEAPKVLELGNTQDGCWKVLQGGEKVPLSPEEWRKELARLFSKNQPTP